LVLGAVDLDDQVLVGPVEVDLDALHLLVDPRLSCCLREELVLEIGSGAGAS